MTGKVFGGRYEIKDRIGIGGMAEVYRAQDSTLGRVVAVKVMLPQFAADPFSPSASAREAAAAANLQSPYIVNVYDWGQDDETYYIVMEFVRGSDLKTAIQQRGAINQRKAAEIGTQVCQALTVAHNQDIIHRDIKPQNIMVQPDGNVEGDGFRHRPSEELRERQNLRCAGHRPLHLAGAGPGQGPHRRQRHLLAGHRAVRGHHGQCPSTARTPYQWPCSR